MSCLDKRYVSVTYSLVPPGGCLGHGMRCSLVCHNWQIPFILSPLTYRSKTLSSAHALRPLFLLALNLGSNGTAMLRTTLVFLSLFCLSTGLLLLLNLQAYNKHLCPACSLLDPMTFAQHDRTAATIRECRS